MYENISTILRQMYWEFYLFSFLYPLLFLFSLYLFVVNLWYQLKMYLEPNAFQQLPHHLVFLIFLLFLLLIAPTLPTSSFSHPSSYYYFSSSCHNQQYHLFLPFCLLLHTITTSPPPPSPSFPLPTSSYSTSPTPPLHLHILLIPVSPPHLLILLLHRILPLLLFLILHLLFSLPPPPTVFLIASFHFHLIPPIAFYDFMT